VKDPPPHPNDPRTFSSSLLPAWLLLLLAMDVSAPQQSAQTSPPNRGWAEAMGRTKSFCFRLRHTLIAGSVTGRCWKKDPKMIDKVVTPYIRRETHRGTVTHFLLIQHWLLRHRQMIHAGLPEAESPYVLLHLLHHHHHHLFLLLSSTFLQPSRAERSWS
jgi:hypothetical protein